MKPALVLCAALAGAAASGAASGAASEPVAPSVSAPAPRPADKCPVCGMFVAKYPQWVATVVWQGGAAVHFDGAKDLFTYMLDLPKHAPGRSPRDVATVAVTEFYDVRTIDARQAFYVVGSDVLGPMGRELVPFASRAAADEFSRDHGGRRVLRFGDVTLRLVQRVDAGADGSLGAAGEDFGFGRAGEEVVGELVRGHRGAGAAGLVEAGEGVVADAGVADLALVAEALQGLEGGVDRRGLDPDPGDELACVHVLGEDPRRWCRRRPYRSCSPSRFTPRPRRWKPRRSHSSAVRRAAS
ncbi:MAG: nitrous oxide reductase accessory protein NosL [Vicinamibacteria bacterium]